MRSDASLVDFVSALRGGDGLRVEETLGSGFVRLRVSEAERRQAKHDIRCVEDAVIELLRNSRDAGAVRLFVSSAREGSIRTITIVDDGTGIPQSMHERIFDARVTSKLDTVHMDRWGVHGRGMALFSIRQNAQRAVVVDSSIGNGTAIQVVFDVGDITERADQSSWPTVAYHAGKPEIRGPRNIYRACVEFALETRDSCKVYVGSPSEVVATMHRRVIPEGSHVLWPDDPEGMRGIPLIERPALARDARQMREAASSLGIEMSERTAHRIVRRQIAPLRNALAQATTQATKSQSGSAHAGSQLTLAGQPRRLVMSDEDRQEFLDDVERAFERIAQRYYVEMEGEPRIRMDSQGVHISFGYRDMD